MMGLPKSCEFSRSLGIIVLNPGDFTSFFKIFTPTQREDDPFDTLSVGLINIHQLVLMIGCDVRTHCARFGKCPVWEVHGREFHNLTSLERNLHPKIPSKHQVGELEKHQVDEVVKHHRQQKHSETLRIIFLCKILGEIHGVNSPRFESSKKLPEFPPNDSCHFPRISSGYNNFVCFVS